MKTLPTVLAALIATMLPNVLSAQQLDRREIQRHGLGFRGQLTLLQTLDTDGNREISADEIKKAGEVLAMLDGDRDGKLTIRELLIPYDAFTRAANVFERLDANDDGTLSSDEIPDGMQRLIERGDTADDGILTKEEFMEFYSTRVTRLFQQFDKDGDGKLSGDEIPEGVPRIIERTDKDDDGVLTKEEFEDVHQRVGFGTYLQMTNSLPIESRKE